MIPFGNSKALVNYANVHISLIFVQVQKIRLKPKLNYPSQFLHMF